MLLVSLADVHSTEGRSARALELLQQAVPRLEGARDERVASALNNLGVVYLQHGRYEDAISSLRKARKHWEKAPEKNREELEANSQLLEEMGNYLSLEQAERLLGPLPAAHPNGDCEERNTAAPAPRHNETPPDPVFPWQEDEAPITEPSFIAGQFLEPTLPPRVPFPGGIPAGAGSYPGAAYPPAAPSPAYPPGFIPVAQPAGGLPPVVAPVYYPYSPPVSQPAPEQGGSNVQLTFVRPDGTPLDRKVQSSTVHLTVLVPDGTIPQRATAVADEPALSKEKALNGWEDLAFDFLTFA